MVDGSSAPAGWYFDGQNVRRRFWNGAEWTDQYEDREMPEPAPRESPAGKTAVRAAGAKLRTFVALQRDKHKGLPPEQLDAILNAEIARWTAKGWTLEATTVLLGRAAMMREPKWRSFLRDFLLVIVTIGVWLIYMGYRRLIGRTSSLVITVNRHGVVNSFKRVDDAVDWSSG